MAPRGVVLASRCSIGRASAVRQQVGEHAVEDVGPLEVHRMGGIESATPTVSQRAGGEVRDDDAAATTWVRMSVSLVAVVASAAMSGSNDGGSEDEGRRREGVTGTAGPVARTLSITTPTAVKKSMS